MTTAVARFRIRVGLSLVNRGKMETTPRMPKTVVTLGIVTARRDKAVVGLMGEGSNHPVLMPQVASRAASSLSQPWMAWITTDPSPTLDATLFTELARTSPTAKIPWILVA